jgi:hypothetical protein
MKLKPALLNALLMTALLIPLLTACAERGAPAPRPTPTPEPGEPAPSVPALPELAPGAWTALSPGGETVCADGSPYTFYVRPGTVNRVVIDFEGGGACWNGATCGEGGPYQPRIPDPEGRAVGLSGLYDKTRPDNPVADWYHVFVSYCTADVHLGDSVETYGTAQGERTVRHNGQKNVAAVLDWVFASFEAPESVLVTGCSAGAYGAALYTPHVADAYPEADITQLGDCGAGIIPETFVEDGLERWNIGAVLPAGVDLDEGVPATFLADAYVAIGEAYPEVPLAQYNSLLDGVQIGFYARQLGLEPTDPVVQERFAEAWVTGLVASLGRIQAGLPEGFSSYTSLLDDDATLQNGTLHCLINRPEFYTLEVNGVPFVAWLDDLLNGDAPPAPVAPPTQVILPELPQFSSRSG